MESFLRDLKLGTKLLGRDKAFTAAAILTLGLAIGANGAIFSVVDSVLLEPLPFPESHRLVTVFNSYPAAGAERASNGVPDYYDRLEGAPAFESLALYNTRSRAVGGEANPQRVIGMNVTPSFFGVLQVEAAAGRTFLEAEGEEGNEKVVVLTHSLHQQLFGGDLSVVGGDMRIDGEPYRLVGVLAEGFLFTDPDVRLFTPLAFTPRMKSDEARHNNSWQMIGRLAPGATLAEARGQLDAINAATLERFPQFRQLLIDAGFHTEAHPFLDDLVQGVRSTLHLLWGGVAFVLLIACVNLANLFLVRSTGRAKELSTRLALGAGHPRIARQLLTESLVLSLCGGLVGLGLAWLAVHAMGGLDLDQLPRGSAITLDASAVALTLTISLVIGLALGSIPVLRTLRLDIESVLREESRGGTGGRGTRLAGRAMVATQVAFAFVLLIGAGLLLASFRQVLEVDPGFEPEGVWTARVSLPDSRYGTDEDAAAFTRTALERLRALPGVEAAGVSSTLPLGGGYSDSVIFPEGFQIKPGESVISPSRLEISPGYLEAMGMELLAGRDFD
ncbi:MAG: ABC transporter permease, partial [Holophagales bacterium]|nr:ABC transporter permease [Holophagales bacterium]